MIPRKINYCLIVATINFTVTIMRLNSAGNYFFDTTSTSTNTNFIFSACITMKVWKLLRNYILMLYTRCFFSVGKGCPRGALVPSRYFYSIRHTANQTWEHRHPFLKKFFLLFERYLCPWFITPVGKKRGRR